MKTVENDSIGKNIEWHWPKPTPGSVGLYSQSKALALCSLSSTHTPKSFKSEWVSGSADAIVPKNIRSVLAHASIKQLLGNGFFLLNAMASKRVVCFVFMLQVMSFTITWCIRPHCSRGILTRLGDPFQETIRDFRPEATLFHTKRTDMGFAIGPGVAEGDRITMSTSSENIFTVRELR